MKNLILKLLRIKPPTQIRLVNIPVQELRLSAWRQNPVLVTKARKVLELDTVRAMLQVAATETPANWSFAQSQVTLEERAIHQSKIEGYNLCLANLQALGEPLVEQKELVATFEKPEAEEQ